MTTKLTLTLAAVALMLATPAPAIEEDATKRALYCLSQLAKAKMQGFVWGVGPKQANVMSMIVEEQAWKPLNFEIKTDLAQSFACVVKELGRGQVASYFYIKDRDTDKVLGTWYVTGLQEVE